MYSGPTTENWVGNTDFQGLKACFVSGTLLGSFYTLFLSSSRSFGQVIENLFYR